MAASLILARLQPPVNGPGMLTNLQALFSMLRDDPHFYNIATYVVCAPLLLIWILVARLGGRKQDNIWFGLAIASSLSMLPVYHRIYDAKLLLLTIPACTVWVHNKLLRWFALFLILAALASTADLSQALLIGETARLRSSVAVGSRISAQIDALPAPLFVSLIALFYLGLSITHCMSHKKAKDVS